MYPNLTYLKISVPTNESEILDSFCLLSGALEEWIFYVDEIHYYQGAWTELETMLGRTVSEDEIGSIVVEKIRKEMNNGKTAT